MSTAPADAWVGLPGGNTAGPVTSTTAAPVYGATDRGAVAGSVAPQGWTVSGGNNSTVFYTDGSGNVMEVDRKSGQPIQQWTPDQWAKQANNDSITGQATIAAHQFAGNLPQDPAGTPGINGSDNPIDGLTGAANTANNTLNSNGLGINVNPDGTISVGGNPLGGITGGGGMSDPSGNIQAAIAQQNAIAAQNGQSLANYQAVNSPNIATPAAIQAAAAGQVDPIQAALAQAQQAQAAQITDTTLTPQQQAIRAQQIAAQRIAPTTVGPTTLANAATIDQSQQAQIRQAQQGLIQGYQDAIAGKEPSAAEIMLRNATDRNVANQYALAQAANGMNTGLAQRTAMINASEANQNAIMQQALLRAQEIAQARSGLAGVADSTRGADIGLATNQAGLQQQTNLANAGAQNTSTLTQAQINAAQQQAQAQLAQQAAIANQGASLQAGTTNATLAQQVAMANAAAQNQTSQSNAQLQQAAALQNAQLGTQASLANANNVTGANTASAQLANAVNIANANNQSQANLTSGQLAAQSAIANANNQVSTNALNQKAQQDLASNQLTAAGQAGQTSVGAGDVYAKLAQAEAQKQAALIGAAGAGIATLAKGAALAA